MASLKIGVLALQGAFAKHVEMLKSLGVDAVEVRTPQELEKCDGLIIPGGESTTIMRQLGFIDLLKPLEAFAKTKPLFGTCAGLILMSKEIIASKTVSPLGLLDVSVERNAYGRQAESFRIELEVALSPKDTFLFPALFIRAPRIRQHSPDIKILAEYEGEPVLVQQGWHLGATFHPELTQDANIHKYFINLVKKSKGSSK